MKHNLHKLLFGLIVPMVFALGFTACSDDDPILDPDGGTGQEQGGEGEEENQITIISASELRTATLALNPQEEAVALDAKTQEKSLQAIVISDKEGGNTQPFLVVVADDTQEAGAGITVAISKEANTFERGDVIRLSLKEATAQLFNGLLQISSQLTPEKVDHVEALAPILITSDQLSEYVSQYVKIEQTQPERGENGTWNSEKNKGNVTMEVYSGESYKIRTNPTASYAAEAIPEDKSGSVAGIAGVFNGTYQLLPCNAQDIQLTEARFEPAARKTTLAEVIASEPGNFEVENLVVVGVNEIGLMVEQEGAHIYIYTGKAHNLSVGNIINVKGKTSRRNGLLQFGADAVLEEMAETEVSYPTAEAMAAAELEAYAQSPIVKYVSYEGTILVSGKYVNVEIDGTSYQGSLDGMSEAFKTQYNKHRVKITGWLFGSFKNFIYTLPTEVTDLGEAEERVPEGAIYYNNFDKDLATQSYGSKGGSWPYTTDFDGWVNHKGSGVENVSYTCQKISIRTNQSSKGELSHYDGSGKNNVFFSTAPNFFTINSININNEQNLRLTFGAQRYAQGASNEFLKSDFVVRVSKDGEVWSQPLQYEFAEADDRGTWRMATIDFSLPEATSTLYIKFVAKMSSVNRIDDLLLTAGKGGQAVVFGGDETVAISSIADVIAGQTDHIYKIKGQIIGIHDKGFLVKDETGVILTFKKKHGMQVGSTITVEGATTEYGGMKQFGETSEIEVLSTGSYTQPNAEVFDAKKIEEYIKSPSIRYVSYEGDLTSYRDNIYQWHYNVAITGSEVIGVVQYPTKDLNIRNFENKKVRVTGYVLGIQTTSENKTLLNTMAIQIEEI